LFHLWALSLTGNSATNLTANLAINLAANAREMRSHSGITIVQGMCRFFLVQALLKECDDVGDLLVPAEQVTEVVALVTKET
jgi:hypothetical protein